MFSIPLKCILYLLYTLREVFIWIINYCHCILFQITSVSVNVKILSLLSIHPMYLFLLCYDLMYIRIYVERGLFIYI